MHRVLFALLTFAAVTPAALAGQEGEPPVRLRLSDTDGLRRGDRVRVYVRTVTDGYLLVLHAEPDGRIRALFPLDPYIDNFVRGAREHEVRARGDRRAIRIYRDEGFGTVYAAFSRDPFVLDPLVRGDHWDYRLGEWVLSPEADAEAELTALVERLATGPFDYDLIDYQVGIRVAGDVRYRRPYVHTGPLYAPLYGFGYPHFGHHGPGLHVSLRLGVGFGFGVGLGHVHPHLARLRYLTYASVCGDPFYYDPFLCDPFFGFHDPFFRGLGHHHGFGHRHVFIVHPHRRSVVVVRGRPVVGGGFHFKSPGGGRVVDVVDHRRRIPDNVGDLRRRTVPVATDDVRRPTVTRRRPVRPATPRGRDDRPAVRRRLPDRPDAAREADRSDRTRVFTEPQGRRPTIGRPDDGRRRVQPERRGVDTRRRPEARPRRPTGDVTRGVTPRRPARTEVRGRPATPKARTAPGRRTRSIRTWRPIRSIRSTPKRSNTRGISRRSLTGGIRLFGGSGSGVKLRVPKIRGSRSKASVRSRGTQIRVRPGKVKKIRIRRRKNR